MNVSITALLIASAIILSQYPYPVLAATCTTFGNRTICTDEGSQVTCIKSNDRTYCGGA